MNEMEKHEQRDQSSDLVKNLLAEIDVYKQAIQDAKDALASAEMELDEVLSTSDFGEE